MRVREAKDFLVRQTEEQALLDGVSFSDIEKRMMYFTESGEMPEDPTELNTAFEVEHETATYECKVGKLMRHAYWRLKKENPEYASDWRRAIKTLSAGDHYIVVLWDAGVTECPPYDMLKLLGTSLLVIIVGGLLIVTAGYVSNRYGIHWPGSGAHDPTTRRSLPVWIQRAVLWLILSAYFYAVVLPLIIKRPLPGLAGLVLKLFSRRKIRSSIDSGTSI
jgi:hypothetical protein